MALAEAMGLLEQKEPVEILSLEIIRNVVETITRHGIWGGAVGELRSLDESSDPDLARKLLDGARRQLMETPFPVEELGSLAEVFEQDDLARLLGSSTSSVRRYVAARRDVPDDVAWRAHRLALIVAELAGTYNDYGIRRWFDRPRRDLGGRAPSEVLSGSWDPDSDDVAPVLELARSRSGVTAA